MASGAHVSEEAGGLGGEFECAGERGEVGGDSEIGAVCVKQVAEQTGKVCGGEIGVTLVDQVIEEAGCGGGEIGVTLGDQVIEEAECAGGKIGVIRGDRVIEEAGCSGDEIVVNSTNQTHGEASDLAGEISAAFGNQITGELEGQVGENEVQFVNQVTEDERGLDGEIGMASGNHVIGETGASGSKIEVASENHVNGEQEGRCGENGMPSAYRVHGEPEGEGGGIGVPSANLVNGEMKGVGGAIGVLFVNQVNDEPLGGGGEFVLDSENQVDEEAGSVGSVIGEGSAAKGNGVTVGVGGEPRVGEKHKWADTKVYHRRTKGEKTKCVLSDITMKTGIIYLAGNGNQSQNNKVSEVNAHESNHINEVNHNNIQVDGNRVVESEKVVLVPSSVSNLNLKQIQPETSEDVISNKELSSARMDCVTPIPNDPPVTNGALRPLNSANDGKVKINLSSTARVELRELKRKFESELYSVQKAVKKMDGGREEVVPEIFHPVANSSVILNGVSSNGFATRVYSGTRSLGHVPYKANIRPFNELRVSVGENGYAMVDSIEREKRTPKANQFYRNSEFLLANDKFPPAESNKKSKSNGKKSSGGDFSFGAGSKVYKSCYALLEKLMKHKHGWVFNAPVDVNGLGLHDYFLIIKSPMDLGTVKAKLIKYWYKSPMEFAEDIRLTFHNAMLYNPKGHDVHIMAETLLKIFEGKWPEIEVKYLRELRMAVEPDMGYPTPTSRITNPFQTPALPPLEPRVLNRSESMPQPVNPKPRTLTPAPSFRTPALKKPKAKDVNKRDMTYDEKQKLSTNLQSLPPEKLDGIIQIIKRRSTALSQNDDEIEVDIDSVDTETLWELDRYVTNYKKSLSKNRRKALLANQMRADARQAAERITIPHPVPPKESTAGYGNETSSLAPHRNDPAANASGSSSSSSSSSSGSSSSGSDSDSSSEESGGHSHGT